MGISQTRHKVKTLGTSVGGVNQFIYRLLHFNASNVKENSLIWMGEGGRQE